MKKEIAIFLSRIIPLPFRRAIAIGLSSLLYHLSLKHRLIAVHNVMRSFPEKTLNEILKIVKSSYASIALTMVEFFDILYLNKDNLHRWVTVKGLDHYEKACREGKGVLLFSAHFGNWEIGSAALAMMTKPLIFMVRLLDSPFLEDASTYVRGYCGNISLHKDKACGKHSVC
jgi:KDO2-lipid IV(A) lauroyltransferase